MYNYQLSYRMTDSGVEALIQYAEIGSEVRKHTTIPEAVISKG